MSQRKLTRYFHCLIVDMSFKSPALMIGSWLTPIVQFVEHSLLLSLKNKSPYPQQNRKDSKFSPVAWTRRSWRSGYENDNASTFRPIIQLLLRYSLLLVERKPQRFKLLQPWILIILLQFNSNSNQTIFKRN